MAAKKKLMLIDGHAILFRAYYAFPPLTTAQGLMVNAVYGFAVALLSVIEEFEPEYLAVMFDLDGKTKRKEVFEAYKAQRKPTPQDLLAQISPTHELVSALGVPIFEMQGYEADDLIGTISVQASTIPDLETVIVTGDKDLFQLISDNNVKVYIPGRGKNPAVLYSEAEVVDKMGVTKDQIVEYKGLAGDPSDNIPGIKGIGPKTAVELLKKYGTIEGIYHKINELVTPELKNMDPKGQTKAYKDIAKMLETSSAVLNKLLTGRDMAFQSRDLAKIMLNAPIRLDLQACKITNYDKHKAVELFEKFGFKSLIRRLPLDEFESDVQEALF